MHTRVVPIDSVRPNPHIALIGVIKGLHSERVYKRLEAAFDGIIKFAIWFQHLYSSLLKVRKVTSGEG